MAKAQTIKLDTNVSREDAIKILKKASKTQSIIGTDEIDKLCYVEKIPTGIPTIDYLGGGGITRGCLTILGGETGSSKSTSTLFIIKSFIKYIKEKELNQFIIIIDPEKAFDPEYAKAIGVDTDYLIIKRNKVIEDGFAEVDTLVQTGFIFAIIIDSLDGMIARKVDDNSYENTMGGTAGALAMHLPNLFSRLVEYNVTSVIIKQARVKMGFSASGNEVITISGGKALLHFADSIFITKRLSSFKLSYQPIQVKAQKTRSSRMGLVLDMPLFINGGVGIDITRDLFNVAVTHGIIVVAGGGWTNFTLGEEVFREQGADKFIDIMRNNKALYNKIHDEVYNSIINISSIIGTSNTVGDEIKTDLDFEHEEEKQTES